MKLPHLFHRLHDQEVFRAWLSAGRPPCVRVIPREPLGRVSLAAPRDLPDLATVVSLRCWNDAGVMRYEAWGPEDLATVEAWAARHQGTPQEDFTWLPT